MKTVDLCDLFSERQCRKIEAILKANAEDLEKVKRLKKYFSNFKTKLRERGVVDAHLAYWLLYNYHRRIEPEQQ